MLELLSIVNRAQIIHILVQQLQHTFQYFVIASYSYFYLL